MSEVDSDRRCRSSFVVVVRRLSFVVRRRCCRSSSFVVVRSLLSFVVRRRRCCALPHTVDNKKIVWDVGSMDGRGCACGFLCRIVLIGGDRGLFECRKE